MSHESSHSKYKKFNSPFVISYRLIILLLGLGDLIYANVLAVLNGSPLTPDKYFTYQSNIFILVWLFLALLWRKDTKRIDKISGAVHAILTVYISVTLIVYHFVLAQGVSPFANFDLQNIIHHYLNPIIFILDFLYLERKNYSWKNIGPLIIYPHVYLVFSFIMGTFITPGDYIYDFLNYQEKGPIGYLTWYIILVLLFLILFTIYTSYVKVIDKRRSSQSSAEFSIT